MLFSSDLMDWLSSHLLHSPCGWHLWGWKWLHVGSTGDEFVQKTQSWENELCGWVDYVGLGLFLLHAVEINPRDISERKVRKLCLCIIKSQLFFWHAFLMQLMNLTPSPLTWLACGGWRWLIHELVMNLFGRRHRVGDESSCGWLGFVGVGFSCMQWRLTLLHSWGISERKVSVHHLVSSKVCFV